MTRFPSRPVPLASTYAPNPSTPSRSRELALRTASSVVLMIVAIAVTWVGGHAFSLVWLLAGLAVIWEWQGLIGGDRQRSRFLIGASALAIAAPLAAAGYVLLAALPVLAAAAAIAAVAPPHLRGFAGAGVIYAGALVIAVCVLRHSFPFGVEAMLWLFAVVWGTDIMAFIGGRLVGGPKLAPRLSPSKTWSGFVVGVVSGGLLGVAVSPYPGSLGAEVLIGLAGGVVAQGGDLFESALKRRFGAKDSGRLIPGHGGAMDRLDGFIAASVFAAGLGLWRFGPDAAGAGLFRW